MLRRQFTIFLNALGASLLFFADTSPAFASMHRDGPSTYITNRLSGLPADISIPASCYIPDNPACVNGTPVLLGQRNSNTKFYFRYKEGGWSEVVWFADYCLDVSGFGTNNGARVILWQCHGGPNQLFRPQAFQIDWFGGNDPNTRLLEGRQSGKCLDAANPSAPAPPRVGAPLQMWDCIGDTDAWNRINQDWAFES
ncbi:RICIN domain-containing protein [Nonomuraea sp. KM90]|uniref:RICIN domain-containing protein n=1 Tax=Nonomuraea sp. KM90 TaxID=3457428 RepID=UPI003FCC2ABB